MAKLNRERMDTPDSLELRVFMGRYDLNLWALARLMNVPSCVVASLLLGESSLDDELRLKLNRAKLEMVFSRPFRH